jgi:hypothetical protein
VGGDSASGRRQRGPDGGRGHHSTQMPTGENEGGGDMQCRCRVMDDVGVPRRSSRCGVAPRSQWRSANTAWVASNDVDVDGGGGYCRRQMLRVSGRTPVCFRQLRFEKGRERGEKGVVGWLVGARTAVCRLRGRCMPR